MADRVRVVLVCSECGARNYRTTKARRPDKAKLQLRKFCPKCNQHTTHRESR